MADENNTYPLTKMNFLVTVSDISGVAAFTEVSGVEATVEEVEFRQGNSNSLSPVKIPGLVKHGNVTLKMGYTLNNAIASWITESISERRQNFARHDVTIELIDISASAPQQAVESHQSGPTWVLKNAWITKYSAPDLNSTSREVAIESLDLAYEELTMPGAGA